MSAHSQNQYPHHNNNEQFCKQNSKNSNVRVVCRIKPLSISEEPIDMKIDKENSEISIIQARQQTTKTFIFNRIFTNESQLQFVKQVCKNVLKRATQSSQGSLIFSYGVTNSGKTHTILGTSAEPGILPYLVKKLSQHGQVYLSAIQLYNDQFFSLTNKQKLIPREQGGFLDFQHCSISQPINIDNLDYKFRQYISNRTQNDNKMNSKSSRSHAIFRIRLGNVNIGVVDLAGSQRTNKIFNTIDQTSNINKSLLCLGRCIKALNENPESHLPIPYRQSKLTKVLIQYFAAKAEVLMIANINQSQACFHQNMKVLDYAVLAKDIRHCTTQSSIKKHQLKFFKSNKVDVFEALYKSATKSAFAHKTLKSSRSKINQSVQKSMIKNTDVSKKFAKALKTQQLQLCIQKFDSSQETFDEMVDYMYRNQIQNDHKQMQAIMSSKYQSPYPFPNKKQIALDNQVNEVGVGRSQESILKMKKQLQQHMKQELKLLIQKQKLEMMQNKQTMIGQSLSKMNSKQHNQQQLSLTPQKIKDSAQQSSFVMKTSSAIYSSVKKILADKVYSIKKIFPKFNKSNLKNESNIKKIQKFSICNYGDLYQTLFKVQKVHKQRESEFSFYEKLNQPIKQTKNTTTENQYQTQVTIPTNKNKQQSTQQTGIETAVQTDDQYPSLQICSKQTEANIKSSQDFSTEKQNQQKINEADDEQSNLQSSKEQKGAEDQTEHNNQRKNRRNKANKSKGKTNEAANRVANTRKLAARLCRQHSRTPMKMRLRNRKLN